MKAKIFTAIFATMAVFLLGLAYASINLSLTNDLTKSKNSTELTITNNENQSYNFTLSTPIEIADNTGKKIIINPNVTRVETENGTSDRILLSYDSLPSNFNYGTFSKEIFVKADEDNSINNTSTLNFKNSFCRYGAVNDSELEIDVSIDNKGKGEDTDWLPNDKIQIELIIDNNKEFDLKNIIFELGLIEKTDGKNVADDLAWLSAKEEKVEVGTIKKGKNKNHVFEFKVASDFGIDEGNFLLFVKVYTENKEDKTCIDYTPDFGNDFYEDISISRESEDERLVVLDDITLEPSTALCGEEVTLKARLYNIGEDDQENVKVKLLANKNLKTEEFYKVINDFDEGDESNVEFTFTVPENAKEGTYSFELKTLYDYDDDYKAEENAAYRKSSEAILAELLPKLIVKGNCIEEATKDVKISPILETPEEEITAGKEITIKSTIKNIGEETTTYTIGVEGNEVFSTTQSISPSSLTLKAGESKDALIKLKLNEEAEGSYLFNIKASFNGEETKQQVSLSVAGGVSAGITGSAIAESFRTNWFVWLIVGINIILILAIIIVALRISKA